MTKPAATKQTTTKPGKQQARSVPKDRHQTISTVGICHEDIATAAYYRAQSLGFSPGNELIDWLEAERQTNAAVKKNRRAGSAVE